MKLIQLNTWEGRLDKAFYRFLEQQQADILMLQEVLSSPEALTDYFDELQLIQQKTGLAHTHYTPTHGHEFCKRPVYFGNAILSSLPFTKINHEFTYREFIPLFIPGEGTKHPKMFQHAEIEVNGKKLNLVNYHGYNEKSKMGNELTDTHCRQLADYISKLSNPIILTGDFNLAPDSNSLAPLKELLINLCIENRIETTRNFLSRTMTPVDYIWVSGDIKVNHFEVLPDLVSDHAALLLEFDL